MSIDQYTNELLPLQLNAEPPIFRSCSLSDLMLLVTVGGLSIVPPVSLFGAVGVFDDGRRYGLVVSDWLGGVGGNGIAKDQAGQAVGLLRVAPVLVDARPAYSTLTVHTSKSGVGHWPVVETMGGLPSIRNNQARQRLLAAIDHIRSLRITIVCLLVVVIAR